MRLMASTVMRMARPGKVTTHGARSDELARRRQHGAPFRRRRLGAEAEKAERCRLENGVRKAERRLDDQRAEAVGQDGDEHQPDMAGAGDLGRGHVFAVLFGQHRGADEAGEMRLQHQGDGQHGVERGQGRGWSTSTSASSSDGKAQDDVHHAHDDDIDPAAEIAGEQAER